jgi:hypothetical protein
MHRYTHLLETTNTELMLVYLHLIELQIDHDRTRIADETQSMWHYHRTCTQDPLDSQRLTTILAARQQQIIDRWQAWSRFVVDNNNNNNNNNECVRRASHRRVRQHVGFRANLIVDSHVTTHTLTNEHVRLLKRGPAYVSPGQLHLSTEFASIDRLVARQYAPMQHQLAHLFQQHRLNLAQSAQVQHAIRKEFQMHFAVPLPNDVHRRAIYERNMIVNMRTRLNVDRLIVRRLADQSNRFYLTNRSTFEQHCRECLRQQTDDFELVYDVTMTSDIDMRQQWKTRTHAFNQVLDRLCTQKRLPVETSKKLQVNIERIKLAYLYFLPSINEVR